MSQWATHITVPVFISGALEDDQTGPQWPALLNSFPATTPVYANIVNGGHIDSTDPQIMSRWLEFLDLYVADEVPTQSRPAGRSGPRRGDQQLFWHHSPGAPAGPPVHHGHVAHGSRGGTSPGTRHGSKSSSTVVPEPSVPEIPSRRMRPGSTSGHRTGSVLTYYFHAGGSLNTTAPKASGSTSLILDPTVRPLTDLPAGANPWAADPPWDWTTVPASDGIAFQTPPLRNAMTIVGPATVDLWVKSSARVEDYQVTVTEARPATLRGGVHHLWLPS